MRFKDFLKIAEGMWFGDSSQGDPGAVHNDPSTQRPPQEYPGKSRNNSGGGITPDGITPSAQKALMKKKMKKK